MALSYSESLDIHAGDSPHSHLCSSVKRTLGEVFFPLVFILMERNPKLLEEPLVLAHLVSSDLTLASYLALHFRAGSLKTSLSMISLFREISTEYLLNMQLL